MHVHSADHANSRFAPFVTAVAAMVLFCVLARVSRHTFISQIYLNMIIDGRWAICVDNMISPEFCKELIAALDTGDALERVERGAIATYRRNILAKKDLADVLYKNIKHQFVVMIIFVFQSTMRVRNSCDTATV